jgi:DNA-binding protein H-NS
MRARNKGRTESVHRKRCKSGYWAPREVGGTCEINNIHYSNHSFSPTTPMQKLDFEKMTLDDLWSLHEKIGHVLSSRILAEKEQLEKRLVQLNRGSQGVKRADMLPLKSVKKSNRPRRQYPKVFPKYQNPAEPSETWSGRGKRPRWLVSALKSGKPIEDFQIRKSAQLGRSAQ